MPDRVGRQGSAGAGDASAQAVPRGPFAAYMAVVLALAVAGLCWIYGLGLNGPPIRSDGMGYYILLPATVIHGDPGLTELSRRLPPLVMEMAGARRMEATGRYLVKYTLGAAVLQAPFFLAAHAWCLATGAPADGFGPPYHVMSMVSALFWLTLGSWLVYSLVAGLYGTRPALMSLGLHTFGTGLFHYATYDASFSHVYSFFAVALLLRLCADGCPGPRRAAAQGLAVGLVFLIRPPNALVGLFCLLCAPGFKASVLAWRGNLKSLAWMAVAFLVCVGPQFAYWKWASGSFFLNVYGDEGFHWAAPQVGNLLFSLKKGLFTYYPLLAFSMAGLLFLRRGAARFLRPALVFTPAMVYVLSSWWCWFYGGGLGQRPFVDFAPLFCLGLAALLQAAPRGMPRTLVLAGAKVSALACVLFAYLYWRGMLPFTGPTWEQFRRGVLQALSMR